MKSLTTLRPNVAMDAPGAPIMLIDAAMNRAARKFLQRAPVWKYIVPVWPIPERACYSLDIPADTEIGDILGVTYLEREIEATTAAELTEMNRAWRTLQGGAVSHYLREDLNALTLYPIPDNTVNEEDSISVKLSLVPSVDRMEIEDHIIERYGTLIEHEALAWLLSRPGQKWSNPAAASDHRSEYYHGLSQAIVDENHNNVRSELQVSMRPFA
jgi:hypothetical protein